MHSIVSWCLNNRPVVVLFSLVLMGAGVFSTFKLNQELLPSVEFPSVFILVQDPGAGPEQVDRDVSKPLSEGLTGLPRLKHVQTIASQGFSTVILTFDLDSSLKEDQDNTNQRLNQVQLPSGVGKPLVQTFSFNAIPSMTYTLAAKDGDLVRATREANDVIAPALTGATGSAQVKVSGGARERVLITLDGAKLADKGLSLQQVQQALSGANVDLPAGTTLDADKTLPVQASSSLRTIDDLKNLVVVSSAEQAAGEQAAAGQPAAGQAATPPASSPAPSRTPAARPSPNPAPAAPPPAVRLGDVAKVELDNQQANGISRTNGLASLQIQVIRASNGNAVTLSDDVRQRIAKLKLDSRDDLQLSTDSAVDIKASLNDLVHEGLIGAGLAILVIFLFLGSLRATLVTAVSLPTSVLVALLGTSIGGFSLNVLTLAGLTIAVGRIVDDAIVVLENSYRHLQQGESPTDAALHGATEVSSAVISSTLTSVAVFLPIGVVGGIISRFFLPFSVTVTISLLASLLVALTLIPVLVSFILSAKARRQAHQAGGRHINAGATAPEHVSRLARPYIPVLAWVLRRFYRKSLVVAVAALALIGVLVLTYAAVPKNFFDLGGSAYITGNISLPPGTTSTATSDRVKAFEAAARSDPDVKTVEVTIASSDFGGYTGSVSENDARFNLIVKNKKSADQVRQRLQSKLDELYGKGGTIGVQSFGPPSSAFSVSLSGRDPNTLRAASDQVVAKLSQNSDLANVKSDLTVRQPETLVSVDANKAAERGLTPNTVAFALAGVLNPKDVGTLGTGGTPITLRVDPSYVAAGKLADLPLGPGTTLKDVATMTRTDAPTTVTRVDGTQQVTVNADVLAADTQGASTKATQSVQSLQLPAGVSISTGGTQNDINDSFQQMFIAIGVAIAIVFIILVTFFRSVASPFVILGAMPLALIGGLLALYFTHQNLGLPALLGVLMVFGIVVSNAILLIDFVERNRAGRGLAEALVLAGSVRIRPILMTAVATIVALVPVATGFASEGGGGLISQSLAVVVEGGLISSTALTLVVVPILYSWIKRRGHHRYETAPPAISVADPRSLRPSLDGNRHGNGNGSGRVWEHFREETLKR
ncbi:MAG: efflux RND transporter permease subunit [Candidatus Dormibacteraeota bacterium]|uniref:Efflux RND transporter permease subunit n=1 Tax=Candidatus Dormiibacter inghamiae TaxID=3127013 RepID=A0A934NAP8_9BACT|nr:efflux RND transporter permease subunit [Candidatus Dormibacteraeota bacterium]